MTYYIILEREWQYDGNVFQRTINDAGVPCFVGNDREQAYRLCFDLNKAELEGLQVQEYGEPFYFLIDELPHLIQNAGKWEALLETLSSGEVREVMSFVGKYPFYFIHTLEES